MLATPAAFDWRPLEDTLRRLIAAGPGGELVRIEPVAPGLGYRHFARLHLRGGSRASVVVRFDAPAPPSRMAPEPPLEPLRSALEAHGVPVPRRYAGDPERGIDLLEDLGATSLGDVLRDASPTERRAWLGRACALAPLLQRLADAGSGLPAFRRRLDAALIAHKAERFAAASLAAGLGRAARDAELAVVREAFACAAEAIEAAPQRIAHRDYQSSNLLVLPPGDARGRLAMVDVQGAFLAPPEYDLVCLLRDSYVELPWDEVCALREAVRTELPDAPPAGVFAERFDLITLVRKGKDHALFHEVAARGRRDWLRHAAPTGRYLRDAAERTAGLDVRIERFAALLAQLLPEATACAR